MKEPRAVCLKVGSLLIAPILVGRAAAQTATSPPAGGTAMTGALVGFAALIVLVVAIGVVVKFFDRRRKRMEEAVAVQARISDALMVDPALGRLPIVTAADRGLWGRSPVMIEIRGPVPSPELREAAISVATREAASSGVPFQVEDRLVVDPLMVEVGAR
jgi:hypothetical protein